MLYSVYKINISKDYRSPICSTAYVINILFNFFAIVIPLIFSYSSQEFWTKEISCTEQPDIQFKNDVILNIETDRSTIRWTTNLHFNDVIKKQLRIPTITSTEHDTNYDGLRDHLDLKIEMALKEREKVHAVTALLIFIYKLKCNTDVIMEGMAIVNHKSQSHFSHLHYGADLVLTQRTLLSSNRRDAHYNQSVFPHKSNNVNDWKLERVLENYRNRNVTTQLQNIYSTSLKKEEEFNHFVADIKVLYARQKVMYHPQMWHIMKMAWIQYLAMFVIVKYLVNTIQNWIYSNQIIRTYVKNP